MTQEAKKMTKQDLADKMHATVDASRDRVVEAYEDAKDSVSDKAAEVSDRALQAREDAKVFVAEHPEESVLGAAAVGFVVGAAFVALISRR